MAMYKIETIKKYVDKLNARMDEYKKEYQKNPIETAFAVSISEGDSKMGRTLNVSIAPIRTCANCAGCSRFCYDIKACLRLPDVMSARARNTVLALYYPNQYFNGIRNRLLHKRNNKRMRWHQGGDIPNYEYFCEMVQIAKDFPDFFFWTYTKNYWIVNRYVKEHGNNRRVAIPKNLVIMYSVWDGMPCINPYHFPEFICKLKKGNQNYTDNDFEKMYRCPGKCQICIKAKRGCIAGETTYCNEH